MNRNNPIDVLLDRAATQPMAPYLHQPLGGHWRSYTWGEVADQARRMATALLALGLQPGDRVAITGLNTAHWIMADYALSLAGLVAVGLYPKQSAEHVRFICADSGLRAAFIGPMPDAATVLGAMPESVMRISLPYPGVSACEHDWDSLVRDSAPIAQPAPRSADDLCTLVYTSGTTGNPKGVMVTLGNMMFCAQGIIREMPPKPGGERFLSFLPLAHAFERGAVELSSLFLNAEIYFLEGIEKLGETLEYVRPTRFFAVPLVWSRMQAAILKKMPQHKLDLLLRIPLLSTLVKRKIVRSLGLDQAWLKVSGAAPLPMPTLRWFARLGVDIMQGYGMTENSIYVSCNLPGKNRPGSVGKPYVDSLVRISPEGEIQNRHGAITRGYYRNDEATRGLFTEDGWLRTGDTGRLDEDGYLYVTGRMKEIFKTLKGKYVTPAPIENECSRAPEIEYQCLVGSGLHQPILVMTLSDAGRAASRTAVEQSLSATLHAVNEGLEDHEKVAKVLIVNEAWTIDNQLLTPTFKVRRSAVERRYEAKLLEIDSIRAQKVIWMGN